MSAQWNVKLKQKRNEATSAIYTNNTYDDLKLEILAKEPLRTT
mgnify:FL=1